MSIQLPKSYASLSEEEVYYDGGKSESVNMIKIALGAMIAVGCVAGGIYMGGPAGLVLGGVGLITGGTLVANGFGVNPFQLNRNNFHQQKDI